MSTDRILTAPSIRSRTRLCLGALSLALLAACGGSSSDGEVSAGSTSARPTTFMIGEAPQQVSDSAPNVASARVAPPTSAKLQKVLLAQSLVQESDDPELALLSRRALLVLVQLTNAERAEPKPDGRIRIFSAAGALLDELPLQPPGGDIPMVPPDNPSFKTAYAVTVPAKHVLPGMKLVLELAGGQLARTIDPAIGPEHAVTLVTVPIRVGDQTGEVPADIGPVVAARLPFSSVRVVAHPPYTLKSAAELPNTPAGWDVLFAKVNMEMMQMQIQEGAGVDVRNFYVGFVPNSGVARTTNYATRAMAIADEHGQSRSAVIKSLIHEFGHSLFLSDAPCGAVQDADKSFPYANGRLGAGSRYTWGFVADAQAFIDPRDPERHDAMSRCSGDTFSDYNYRKMMATLAPGGWLALR